MPLGANVLPWLRGRELARLDRMLAYFLLLNQVRAAAHALRGCSGLPSLLTSAPIRWRLHSSLFSFPWELWLASHLGALVRRRSLVTGQNLPCPPSPESPNAC